MNIAESNFKWKRYFAWFAFFVIGFALSWVINSNKINKRDSFDNFIIRSDDSEYKLIKPLLVLGDSKSFLGFSDIENKVKDQINQLAKDGTIELASVYFKDFNSGRWMGVNEKLNYAPASINKVALMISVLKKAETDSSYYGKKIVDTINPSFSFQSAELNAPKLVMGRVYSKEELLRQMIIYSDNDAMVLLSDSISEEDHKKTFDALQVVMPSPTENGDTMSPEMISRFFRTLYNSTYLSRSSSEFALELLSQTAFKDGLVSGVATGVTVAHKYGHRTFTSTDTETGEELHDCGIVYHPSHPYFACIMTKGVRTADLISAIKQISATIYQEVDKNSK
jgi:beta-lactamase class A